MADACASRAELTHDAFDQRLELAADALERDRAALRAGQDDAALDGRDRERGEAGGALGVTPRASIASASTACQRSKASPAATRPPGLRSPSTATATTGQPAEKPVSRKMASQVSANSRTARTGSSSASAAASPAAMKSPA